MIKKVKDNLWQEFMFNDEILKYNDVVENKNDENDEDEKSINFIMDDSNRVGFSLSEEEECHAKIIIACFENQ